MNNDQFTHLILLIGTNPLPNFVVADYFLQTNPNLRTIWLIHSEENNFQAGTNTQAENLEKLLRKRWGGKHTALQFPLPKISISDVSEAQKIQYEIRTKVFDQLERADNVHLNYTGGTKSMSTHVYLALKQSQQGVQYSYLDGRNFRIVKDHHGVIVDDLRNDVACTFSELIDLHGFKRCNKEKTVDFAQAFQAFQEHMSKSNSFKNLDGHVLETYIAGRLEQHLKDKLNTEEGILQNWEIQKPGWGRNHFELDVIILHGYQLTGISCTTKDDNTPCKNKGFEILHRTKQIGGDEAKAVLVTGMKSNKAKSLEKELMYDTGTAEGNILVLGIHDFKNDLFASEIEIFIFGKQ